MWEGAHGGDVRFGWEADRPSVGVYPLNPVNPKTDPPACAEIYDVVIAGSAEDILVNPTGNGHLLIVPFSQLGLETGRADEREASAASGRGITLGQ